MPNTAADLAQLLARAERVLARLEAWLPAVPPVTDWDAALAFRWRKRGDTGWIEAVPHPHKIELALLTGIDEQKQRIEQNTRQFLAGRPANNVLLTGARGTGKSSLVKALLSRFAHQGLRLVEVDKAHLVDLADIAEQLVGRRERFIVFCDDLSFETGEPGYKALKAVLDGAIAAPPDNVLVYATSNRRHLMPEYMAENELTRHVGNEVHPFEAVEEKISLSERFGLWLSFYPFDQDVYLAIVQTWLQALGVVIKDPDAMRRAALQWSLTRGARSGRVAWQFARDYAGRQRGGKRK
ncbi:ATPase AAA [Sulfuriferula plumbiphila]|uniref:ATPase AAA n=1 Tax=Sulfuriferula plumbiphila TaxID=171865 RepID=A0A512L9I1_9PROT|nr:ATP-binding protein [Sulfuriferula plumbiphila]BBP05992.1 ATPase AAA [Sulfuriferula plumbiphila]GEP31145.1 ATPase AAA [Sulfuriferula plumbiphila]